jgi:hypothetical protein
MINLLPKAARVAACKEVDAREVYWAAPCL